MIDYRVLFQYLDLQGNPHFEFTTVLADSVEEAGMVIQSARQNDINLTIIQVVEANDVETGFPDQSPLGVDLTPIFTDTMIHHE